MLKAVSLDPNDFESSKGYDPNKFYVPSVDSEGNSSQTSFRYNASHARKIGEVVGDRSKPFKTSSDFLRWAVSEGLAIIGRYDPKMASEVKKMEFAEEAIRKQKEQADVLESLEQESKVILALLDNNGIEKAAAEFLDAKKRLLEFDQGFWRDWFLDKLEVRFGWLADKQRVS